MTMSPRRLGSTLVALLACVGVLAFVPAASASTTISTVGAWNGSDEVDNWGVGTTPTYGQTIVGTGATLQSFTFYLDVPSTATFHGAVWTWTGTSVGTKLWESGDMNVSGSGYQPATFTPNVFLNAGQQYVIFATTQGVSGSSGAGPWGAVPVSGGDAYPQGQFVYMNGNYLDTWDGGIGQPYASQYDLAFTLVLGGGSAGQCWNDLGTGGCAQLARVAVCDKAGGFQDIELNQWLDTKSEYYGDPAAAYVQGFGLTCALSDIATYGGDPSAYADAGYKVDNTGTRADDGIADMDFGAFYEYFAKKA
jgi:hypothetical protein